MVYIGTQTDSVAGHVPAGPSAWGTGHANAAATQSCGFEESGTAGATNVTVTISQLATENGYYMESIAGEPGNDTWPAPDGTGAYTVRLNVSTGQGNVTLEGVHLVRLNSTGVYQETIASVSNLAQASAGTHNITYNTGNAGGTAGDAMSVDDRIGVVWFFANDFAHGSRDIVITPSLDIDTDIASAAAVFNELEGRIQNGASTAQATLDVVDNNVNLTGRVLCHGLSYSFIPPPVDVDLTGRTSSAATTRAQPALLTDLSARTLGSATTRATPQPLVALTGRTPSISSTRGALTQVVGAGAVGLTGRTLAGASQRGFLQPIIGLTGRATSLSAFQAGLAQVVPGGSTNVALTGRTLCHGLTYSFVPPPVFAELTGRTLSVSQTRGVTESLVGLTGRVPAISSTRGFLQPVIGLTGRATSLSAFQAGLTQAVAGGSTNVALTGRTLCHGLTYSTPASSATNVALTGRVVSVSTTRGALTQETLTVDLTGRTTCISWLTPEIAAPAAATVALTGRTLSASTTRALVQPTVEITGRTPSISATQAGLSQSIPGVVTNVALNGRVMGGAYTQAGPLNIAIDVLGRTFSSASTRAAINKTIDFEARSFAGSFSRADFTQVTGLVDVDLTGRILSGSYVPQALLGHPGLVTNLPLFGRIFNGSFSRAPFSAGRSTDVYGLLRGEIVSYEEILGETGRLTPRGEIAGSLVTTSPPTIRPVP
jgi:hypothetical protein